jgi:hypothetical protein
MSYGTAYFQAIAGFHARPLCIYKTDKDRSTPINWKKANNSHLR